jgi:6,7-dimethyl-8-ribityllumazine synthase
MQGAEKGQGVRLDGRDLRVGIVQARFNEVLTGQLAQACMDELKALGVQAKHIQHVTVPGALEVPVVLQAMALWAASSAVKRITSSWWPMRAVLA